jgi:translation initiation factor 2 alpha subunit (eIF-2alpha)
MCATVCISAWSITKALEEARGLTSMVSAGLAYIEAPRYLVLYGLD